MSHAPSLLLTGASGLVGTVLSERGLAGYRTTQVFHRVTPRSTLRRGDQRIRRDLTASGAVGSLFDRTEPETVVHAAAMAGLGDCERRPEQAHRMNVAVTAELARRARETGAYLVFFSTDQVFDGEGAPYTESDSPSPLTVYGKTKDEAEQAVLDSGADALIIRLALVLGWAPDGKSGALDMLRPDPDDDSPRRLFEDEWRTPVSAYCVARVVASVLRERPTGILHLGGQDRVNRVELGRLVTDAMGWDTPLVAGSREVVSYPRPRDVSLDLSRLDSEACPRPLGLADALAELRDVGGR